MTKGQITPDLIGAWVSCYIEGTFIPEGRIQRERDKYYICQNLKLGNAPDDRLGFEKGWCIEDGSARCGNNNGVTNLILLPKSYHLADKSIGYIHRDAIHDRPSFDIAVKTSESFTLKSSLFKKKKVIKLNQNN